MKEGNWAIYLGIKIVLLSFHLGNWQTYYIGQNSFICIFYLNVSFKFLLFCIDYIDLA